jgi:hypothetical protein
MFRPRSKMYLGDFAMQILGMYGVSQTIRRTFGWTVRLMFRNPVRRSNIPASRIPMRSIAGGAADHALPGTPEPELVQIGVPASRAS